ncbi:DNA excision repair protein ERCC-1 [Chelonus insularis]|uniref:DNA excision repair protein ERCC-1 n=1 Tax=Chelonus insularis TaxID=460826 RepID=UPI00158D4E09|nr:DNA excision repair protein ERCC-1 [Chelonus insularis]XP_034939873.1 DNA excision repair protein ERCC-1 [Chelonus insularis]
MDKKTPENNEKVAPPPAKQTKTESSTSGSSVPKGSVGGAILVNTKQRGNPLLKYIKSVPWEYAEVVPDYVMGADVCALFLSIRYHQLNPDYIHERLKLLGNAYRLRVLLVHVDTADPNHALKHLTRICLLADLTLMLAWSNEDAAKIIETYKIFEFKPPEMIMERSDMNPQQKLINALTSVRSVNKTDAMTLLRTFGTVADILKATPEALALCPGIGIQKAKRLHKVLHEPFLRVSTTSPQKLDQ